MYIEFKAGDNQVAIDGINIDLLPKEYALLQFLHLNRGRSLSREQLLDKVWAREFPIERTVDDHIYRLRKKLSGIEGIDIRTIRGFGYSLVISQHHLNVDVSPTLQDAELNNMILDVFAKYHQYGQGKSMLTLARHHHTLGYEVDPHYLVVLHFVQGDLQWLLYNEQAPLDDRLFYLVLFHMFSRNPEEMKLFCERVITKGILAPHYELELEILLGLNFLALAGKPDEAIQRLVKSNKVIADPDYENFIPNVRILELFVHLVAETDEQVLNQMEQQIEIVLQAKPFLREIGSYKVVQGLRKLQRGQWREADACIEEGLQVLDMSGFIPLRLYELYRIYYFTKQCGHSEGLVQKYECLYNHELEKLGNKKYGWALEKLLNQLLTAP